MAKLKVYPHGMTGGLTSLPPHTHGPKTKCSGWSRSSLRSLIRFLYSVNISAHQTGVHSYTLTVRNCPPSSDDWKRLRESFFRALLRHHVRSIFWLTEWQARGVPHLHGIVVLPEVGFNSASFLSTWLRVAERFEPSHLCQTVRHIYDVDGWSKYLAKHSARGLHNYQRSRANIPKLWMEQTGRMWGRRGPWEIVEPMEFGCSPQAFFELRRMLRNRAVADARQRALLNGSWRSVSCCRSSLRCGDKTFSRVRGLSHFCDLETTMTILDFLSSSGHGIDQ